MTSKPPIHRHPIVGTRHPDHPVAVHHHDQVMAREHRQHVRHKDLSFHHDYDPPNPLPHEHDQICSNAHGRKDGDR